jgi:histone H1/5
MLNKLFHKKHVSDESLSEIKRIIIESHKLSEDRHMLHLESVKSKEQLNSEKSMTKRLEKENSDLKKMLDKALNNNELLAGKVSVKKTTAKRIATTAAKTVSKEDEKLLSRSIGMMKDIKAKLTSAEKTNTKVKAEVSKLNKKVTAKKTPAKKIVAKKAPVKKVVKKAPTKKVVAKKASAKKVVKKAPAKKVVAKKASAKKVAKKAPAKKVVKKKSAKKSAVKKK